MGLTRRNARRYLPTSATPKPHTPNLCLPRANMKRLQDDPPNRGICFFRYGKRFRPVKFPLRKPKKSAMKLQCVGLRASTSFLSAPIMIKVICIITSITTPRQRTAHGSSITSSARPSMCGGSPTVYVWSIICPLSPIRNSTARADSSITVSGSARKNRLLSKRD